MSTPGGSEKAWIWDAVATKAANVSSLIPISINPTLLLSIQRGVERDCKDSRLSDRTGSLLPPPKAGQLSYSPDDAAATATDGLARRGAAQSVGSIERKENDFGGGRRQLGGLNEGGAGPFNRYSQSDNPFAKLPIQESNKRHNFYTNRITSFNKTARIYRGANNQHDEKTKQIANCIQNRMSSSWSASKMSLPAVSSPSSSPAALLAAASSSFLALSFFFLSWTFLSL